MGSVLPLSLRAQSLSTSHVVSCYLSFSKLVKSSVTLLPWPPAWDWSHVSHTSEHLLLRHLWECVRMQGCWVQLFVEHPHVSHERDTGVRHSDGEWGATGMHRMKKREQISSPWRGAGKAQSLQLPNWISDIKIITDMFLYWLSRLTFEYLKVGETTIW